MTQAQTVFFVDDDEAMRESMALLLEQAGFQVETFPCAQAFLDACLPSAPGCLVLDLRMPEMNGIELQKALAQKGYALPIVFLSAYGDIPTTVRAIRRGAVDFLEKPVAKDTLIACITRALEEDRRQSAADAEERTIRALYDNLTPREREVMALVTRGLANKEIARHLGISPRTVENHRARVMEKMQAENIAELCRLGTVCVSPGDSAAA